MLNSCSCLRSLLNLCSVKNQDAVLKLVVATLDYSRDGLSRVILSKILTAANDVRHRSTALQLCTSPQTRKNSVQTWLQAQNGIIISD